MYRLNKNIYLFLEHFPVECVFHKPWTSVENTAKKISMQRYAPKKKKKNRTAYYIKIYEDLIIFNEII